MTEKYESLPEWVRWVLLLPLSVGFSLVVGAVLSLLREDFVVIGSAAAMVSLSYALHGLAPRWKNGLVRASLILRMLLSIGMICLMYAMGGTLSRTAWLEMGRELIGWVAGWSLYFSVFREKREHEARKSNSTAEPVGGELGSEISWAELHDTGFPYSSDSEMRQGISAGNVVLLFDRGLSLQLVMHGFRGSKSQTRLILTITILQYLVPILFVISAILTRHYWYLLALILFLPGFFLSYSYCARGGALWKPFVVGTAISIILLSLNLSMWALFAVAIALQAMLLWSVVRISISTVQSRARLSDAFVHLLWKGGVLSLLMPDGKMLYHHAPEAARLR
jgi:hypothetical protein